MDGVKYLVVTDGVGDGDGDGVGVVPGTVPVANRETTPLTMYRTSKVPDSVAESK